MCQLVHHEEKLDKITFLVEDNFHSELEMSYLIEF